MICKSCTDAAVETDIVRKESLHARCANLINPQTGEPRAEVNDDGSGSHCDCHHRIGATAKHIQPEAVAAMKDAGLTVHEE